MQGDPRRDREWEHWPGRKPPDDGIRHRLKSLFTPTEGEDAVEALIVERGREIEERTLELQDTIADLERREEQTGRLRSAVEEMLRHGSAELDERHAELAALAAELRTRDEQVRAAERDIAVRKQELGAVELRRAAVERREAAVAERDTTLARIASELTMREEQLAAAEERRAELDAEIGNRQRALAASQAALLERERQIGDREAELTKLAFELTEREHALEADRANVTAGREELSRAVANVSSGLRLPGGGVVPPPEPEGHVLYVATGGGYQILERESNPPAVGTMVDLDGQSFVVERTGRSPLPGDGRPCAYLSVAAP